MKYKVLGPRILIKVKKFNLEEFLEKKKYVEGSSVIIAPDVEDREEALEREIISQTAGEVVEIGDEAYKRTETKVPWVSVGDKVHFQRYGAQRIGVKEEKEFEYWVINDIDILAIATEENKENV